MEKEKINLAENNLKKEYKAGEILIATKVKAYEKNNTAFGKILAKISGERVALVARDYEPGYRDVLTNEFYHSRQIIDSSKVDYDKLELDKVYLFDLKPIWKISIAKNNSRYYSDCIELGEIKEILHLDCKEDQIIDVEKVKKDNNEKMNSKNDIQYYIGELYRDNKPLNKKIVGTIKKEKTTIGSIAHYDEEHIFMYEYNSNCKYLSFDNIRDGNLGAYHGLVVKNLVPLNVYLNKSQGTEEDIKALLQGKAYIIGGSEYQDVVLKTIYDYLHLFTDNDKKVLLNMANDYVYKLNKLSIDNKTADMKDLQKKYLNEVYAYVFARSKAASDINTEFQTLKKLLESKKS